MARVVHAVRQIGVDQEFLGEKHPSDFVKRGWLRAYATNSSLRAAFWMRLSAETGLVGHVARSHLLRVFGCDVSEGAVIEGALELPHPTGIVIGRGVVLRHGVRIYQGVTVGRGRGGYPTIETGATLLPNCVVAGDVVVGSNATVGALALCKNDVPPATVFAPNT
ncbi:hypothetical protein QQX10_08505 [Demequina sp. SYSU T00039]|uniref:Serine acetyltransferase n=1 Tax=Demequina lignilytica TaxID=3051663 RepID=A0AAW7M6U3_9MICO|nr:MULTISPECIES: hypothetical protein [unclassified Demequina]MDN4477443.1 hypothetical protein [Demequina sp. SYSU T00039-1]MDN4488206.1 hypothetical protein [Demequina sp. SYSU T00039]